MTVSFFRGLPLTLAAFSSFILASAQAQGPTPTGVKYGDLSGAPPFDVGLKSQGDLEYTVDIVLGGQNFTVTIDTGSTDLWVNMDLEGIDVKVTNVSDVQTDSQYAMGDVKGNIAFAELRIGPYVIPSQAFINATNITSMPDGTQGIIGMAFDTARIYEEMQKAWGTDAANTLGRGPMSNLIAQNPSVPGFFDLQLGRQDPLTLEEHNNHLLIGQHLATATAVANMPKIERINPKHWTLPLDGLNINGKPFTGWRKSGVAGTPPGKIAAVLDSGFSLSLWPNEVVDAVYGSIPGAVKVDGPIPGTGLPLTDNWVVPCNISPNISFVFGGQEYFVHPFDILSTLEPSFEVDGVPLTANGTICCNIFGSGDLTDEYDIILGMGFLRNVYASFQYGDYAPGVNITGQQPFVQMLSTTDPVAAYAEFINAYEQQSATIPPMIDPATYVKLLNGLNSIDNSTAPTTATTATTGATPGPTSSSVSQTSAAQDLSVAGAAAEDSSSNDSSNNKYGAIALGLLGANVVIGLLVFGITLTLCTRSANNRREARYKPLSLPKEDLAADAERGPLYSD
ncbi:acid protease [Lenzites betulinus]|nr:acid protease [Lenzites betulinus]